MMVGQKEVVNVVVYLLENKDLFEALKIQLNSIYHVDELNDEVGLPSSKAYFKLKNSISERIQNCILKRPVNQPSEISIEEFTKFLYRSLFPKMNYEHVIALYQFINSEHCEMSQEFVFTTVLDLYKNLFYFNEDTFDFIATINDVYIDKYHNRDVIKSLETHIKNWKQRLFKSISLYVFLLAHYNEKELRLKEEHLVMEKSNLLTMGLIGPDFGFTTKCLEKLFGSCKTCTNHALYHDVFGRLQLQFEVGSGYTYAFKLNSFLKRCPLVGHIAGLFCNFFNLENKIYI